MLKTETANLSATDIKAIQKISDEWRRCVLARDFEGVSRQYTQDATFMPPNQPAVQGRNAIRDWMSNFPRVMDIRIEHQETDGRDDLAYVRGTYTMKFQPEGAPNPMEDTGKWLVICKKQPNGSWLWAVDTYSSDKPTM